jgi:hypothetical protein
MSCALAYTGAVLPQQPHKPSRRELLLGTAAACVAALRVPSTLASAPVDEKSAVTVAQYVRANCSAFLRARGGVDGQGGRSALWRGGDMPGLCHPPVDLFDARLFGDAGAEFFHKLERRALRLQGDGEEGARWPLPSLSHIATGKLESAAAWGRPVSIWPVGETFRFMFWEGRSLIYDEALDRPDDAADPARIAVVGKDLGRCIESGKEILFEMSTQGFLAVSEDLTGRLVDLLAICPNLEV